MKYKDFIIIYLLQKLIKVLFIQRLHMQHTIYDIENEIQRRRAQKKIQLKSQNNILLTYRYLDFQVVRFKKKKN